MPDLSILVSGDLHIGRTSTRLPDGLPAETARAVNGWFDVVEHAVSGGFDLLVLTGDLADEDNRFWEAIGPLEAGLRRLAGHGIRTLAVSGNHDHGLLPRLAEALGTDGMFKLLGRGGRWERETIVADGRPVLHLDGWSFPNRTVSRDPSADYRPEASDGVPVLGIVHGDLNAPGSRYAPLSLSRLLAQPVDGWLLGHVHKPGLPAEDRPFVLYPGSPQALDFGESGVHGPWRIEVEEGRIGRPEQIALSCCRYEELQVDLSGVADESASDRRIFEAVRGIEERARRESHDRLQALSLRLRLRGRTPLCERADRLATSLGEYAGATGALAVRIDRVLVELLPAVDLEALSRGSTPLAVAAGMLLALEQTPDAPASRKLISQVLQRLEEVRDLREYRAVRDAPGPDDAQARKIAQRQLGFLVGQLLGQQERQA